MRRMDAVTTESGLMRYMHLFNKEAVSLRREKDDVVMPTNERADPLCFFELLWTPTQKSELENGSYFVTHLVHGICVLQVQILHNPGNLSLQSQLVPFLHAESRRVYDGE